MKSTIAGAVAAAALLGAALHGAAAAQARPRSRCSAATLSGSYGFSVSGTNLRIGQFAMVGRFASDGKGSFTGLAAQSINGTITRRTLTGTYKVEADCTGSATLDLANGSKGTMMFVIVDQGNELFFLMTDPGIIESGTAKRILQATPVARLSTGV